MKRRSLFAEAERRGRGPLLLAGLLLSLLAPSPSGAQERGANALGDAIGGLGVTMRVLVIGAHPDDEDTRLIAWLQKGHRAEVAYLSLTRGDGGQNLIGNELGEALGVIRTEELLTARRVDGAHQYFTRAYDFGFSKSAAETYKHWPHDSILKDVVTIVRAFRPQVIVTVFGGTPADGHGQHQVSAIVGREAYDLAGDSVRFPAKSTQGLAPWTVSKFYRDRTYWGPPYSIAFNAGDYDVLLGRSYAEMAVISRSQHRSQGTGALPRKGPSPIYLMREATRVNARTDSTKESSLFDGVTPDWPPVTSGRGADGYFDSMPAKLAALRAHYDPWRPEETVAVPLGRIFSPAPTWKESSFEYGLAEFDAGSMLMTKASEILLLAHGIVVEASANRPVVAVGDTLHVAVSVFNRGGVAVEMMTNSVHPTGTSIRDTAKSRRGTGSVEIAAGSVWRDTITAIATRLTAPWWLATPRAGDLYSQPVLAGAEDRIQAGALVGASFALDGVPVLVFAPVVYRYADPVKGGIEHPIAIAPAVTLTLDTQIEYVPANGAIDRAMHVRLRSASAAPRSVTVALRLPKGLSVDSASRTIALTAMGAATVDFRVRGSLPVGAYRVSAVAESNGQTFATGFQSIEYDHIRPQTLYRDATVMLQAVDVRIPPNTNVAYIPGVGDNSAPALQQLGIAVTLIDPATLGSADLAPYSTIVIGSRAYEAHPELVANNARLLDWVKRGGTMVVQYGQYEMTNPGMMPYPITLTRPAARVTEEDAAVTVLAPKNPLLNTPNKIGPDDWKGWVQDFGLYMPSTYDPAYTPLVSLHDTGEEPNTGGLLVAPYGRGEYVYATLAFFRQLPAGVPGAARLFVNLLGARQGDAPRVTP